MHAVATRVAIVPSVYEEPAPSESASAVVEDPPVEPVLNPFAVYAKGEDLLRRQLGALSARHLRSMAVGYELVCGADLNLQALSTAEMIDLIVDAVSRRRAA